MQKSWIKGAPSCKCPWLILCCLQARLEPTGAPPVNILSQVLPHRLQMPSVHCIGFQCCLQSSTASRNSCVVCRQDLSQQVHRPARYMHLQALAAELDAQVCCVCMVCVCVCDNNLCELQQRWGWACGSTALRGVWVGQPLQPWLACSTLVANSSIILSTPLKYFG
jgi:hypothetical protein